MMLNKQFPIKKLRLVPFLMVIAIALSACSTFLAPVAAQAGSLTAVPTGIPATGNASPKAYIGLFKDNAVAVLDTGTNKVIKTIPVPTGPHGMAITPDGRWVYVSSDGESKVSVIDTRSDTVVKSIEVGKSPHGLALTSDGRTLLAAVFGASQVAFIDTARGQVTGRVAVPSPHNIAISPDNRTAYVAGQKQGASGLAVIDVAGQSEKAFIPLDKAPRALTFSPDGRQLYFTQAGVNAVQALDPATNQVTARIDVGASPHHPLFDPDGKASMALVAAQGSGEVDFIDTQTNVAFFNLPTGKMPHWIAIDPRGSTAWVTNEGSNTVSVIDLNKFTVTATIPVGSAPRKLVVQPGQPATPDQEPANRTAPAVSHAAAASPANSVLISAMAFTPANITIQAGQTVTWANQDSIPHTVTSDQNLWDSGPVSPRGSFSHTFTEPGAYAYHCSIHPFMTGEITVTQ